MKNNFLRNSFKYDIWSGNISDGNVFKNKSTKIVLIIIFSVLFPYIVTIITNGKWDLTINGETVYNVKESGQVIVIKDGLRTEKLDVEKFIPCALMAVADIDTEEEVLKALAVLIRTEIKYKMRGLSKMDADALNMKYITYQSMEKLWKDEFAKNYNYLMKIVNHTSCQTVKYEGNLIMPYYHSVSAGVTREGAYKYLISAKSEGDLENKNYLNDTYFTNEEFVKKIKSINKNIDIAENAPLVTFQVLSKDSAGYVLTLQIGGYEMTGEEFAKKFNLKSTNFNVETYKGNVKITTKGEGHGFGVSIGGAGVYAKAGWTYVQILTHYYPEDIVIE